MSTPIPRNRHRWLGNPGSVATLSGVALAALYASVSVDFPPGTRLSFAIILLVVTLLALAVGDFIEQRNLTTLRALSEGTAPVDPRTLLEAAHEVVRQPEGSFAIVFGFLVFGAIATALTWALVAAPPTESVLRLGAVGILVAPLTSVLAWLACVPRSRVLLRELVDAGLPARDLFAALPVRFILRRRVMLFSGVAVLTPMMLLVDLSLSRLDGLLGELVKAPSPASMDALFEASRSASWLPVGGLLVYVLILVSISAWLSGAILGDPLRELAAETERLSRGEHRTPRFIPSESETLAAAAAIAALEDEVIALLFQLGQAARELTQASGALSPDQTAPEPAFSLDVTTSTSGQLARSARDIAGNAQRVSELARRTWTAARSGRDGADGFLTAMSEVRQGNQAIADSVVRLNKRVQQVGRIIEFINGIADRSDLLALNAELEGNKAGEVGRGFSLVAAEMRRLAESVMQSTREIAGLIDDIRDATNAAVMATEAGVKATDAGAGLAQKVSQGLTRIVDYANQSSDAMQRISLATDQQRSGTDQLTVAMDAIVATTGNARTATAQMVEAHRALLALVADLERTVSRFEVRT